LGQFELITCMLYVPTRTVEC